MPKEKQSRASFNIQTRGHMSPSFQSSPPIKWSVAYGNYPFPKSLTLELKKLLLNKLTVSQIVTVSGKYEIWECLLSHLEVCLL